MDNEKSSHSGSDNVSPPPPYDQQPGIYSQQPLLYYQQPQQVLVVAQDPAASARSRFKPSVALLRITLIVAVVHFLLACLLIATQIYLNVAQNTALYNGQNGIWCGVPIIVLAILCLVMYIQKFQNTGVIIATLVLSIVCIVCELALIMVAAIDMLITDLVNSDNPHPCGSPENKTCPFDYTANSILMVAALIAVMIGVFSAVLGCLGCCRCCRECCRCSVSE